AAAAGRATAARRPPSSHARRHSRSRARGKAARESRPPLRRPPREGARAGEAGREGAARRPQVGRGASRGVRIGPEETVTRRWGAPKWPPKPPARPYALQHLAGRAARGDDILDNEAVLTGRQREPAPQPHHAVLPLREERADAERACDFMGHEDAADGRGEHALGAGVAEWGGQRVAEPRRVLGILKNERRLQINIR